MNLLLNNKVIIFAGHYGSGKTNLATNLAFALNAQNHQTTVCDLDIVNPYFRTKDFQALFSQKGVELIVSDYANSNLDVPAIPAKAYQAFDQADGKVVVDLGGDDRGALALGRFRDKITDYQMVLVINQYRPLTSNFDDLAQIKAEIETACGVAFTAIVNNSNLGAQTTAQDVLASLPFAKQASDKLGLPIAATSCLKELLPDLQGRIENPFPIDIFKKEGWQI